MKKPSKSTIRAIYNLNQKIAKHRNLILSCQYDIYVKLYNEVKICTRIDKTNTVRPYLDHMIKAFADLGDMDAARNVVSWYNYGNYLSHFNISRGYYVSVRLMKILDNLRNEYPVVFFHTSNKSSIAALIKKYATSRRKESYTLDDFKVACDIAFGKSEKKAKLDRAIEIYNTEVIAALNKMKKLVPNVKIECTINNKLITA